MQHMRENVAAGAVNQEPELSLCVSARRLLDMRAPKRLHIPRTPSTCKLIRKISRTLQGLSTVVARASRAPVARQLPAVSSDSRGCRSNGGRTSHLVHPLRGSGYWLYGAAPESNRPSVGLPHRTGFEDLLGHRARAAPPGKVAARLLRSERAAHPLIDPEDADGPLAEEYDAAVGRAGKVFNIVRSMSLHPGGAPRPRWSSTRRSCSGRRG